MASIQLIWRQTGVHSSEVAKKNSSESLSPLYDKLETVRLRGLRTGLRGRNSFKNWHVLRIKRRKILQNVFASDISRAGCFIVIPIWRRDGEDSSRSCWTLSVHAIIITAHRIPVLIAPITLAVMAFYSRNGKAVGSDSIPIEAWKSFSSFGVLIHTEIFNHILNTGKPLHQWWLSFIIPIYKGRECSGMW